MFPHDPEPGTRPAIYKALNIFDFACSATQFVYELLIIQFLIQLCKKWLILRVLTQIHRFTIQLFIEQLGLITFN